MLVPQLTSGIFLTQISPPRRGVEDTCYLFWNKFPALENCRVVQCTCGLLCKAGTLNDNDSGYKDYMGMYFKGGQSGQSGQSSESWFTLGVQSSCQQSELFLIIANLNTNVIANLNIKQHENTTVVAWIKRSKKGERLEIK